MLLIQPGSNRQPDHQSNGHPSEPQSTKNCEISENEEFYEENRKAKLGIRLRFTLQTSYMDFTKRFAQTLISMVVQVDMDLYISCISYFHFNLVNRGLFNEE